MPCTNLPLPSCHEIDQRKEVLLEISERTLLEFGYPKRAKYLVESIESHNYCEDFYIEYVVYFAGRKRNKKLINTNWEYTKSLQKRVFRSKYNFLDR